MLLAKIEPAQKITRSPTNVSVLEPITEASPQIRFESADDIVDIRASLELLFVKVLVRRRMTPPQARLA